ncbi:MAG: hypothetical protein GF398_00565 [Chitinivibrionales bacterium]|nr:hypothetical protein [Chitinivibrionales bacterium]
MSVATVNGTDTTWEDFTRTNPHSNAQINAALFYAPVMSTDLFAEWELHNATIESETADSLTVFCDNGLHDFFYIVNKSSWLITRVFSLDSIYYDAYYYYLRSNGKWILSVIANLNDTTLNEGGVRFSMIAVNGNDAVPVAQIMQVRQPDPSMIRLNASIISVNLPRTLRNAIFTMTTLDGQTLLRRRLDAANTVVIGDTSRYPAGTYLGVVVSDEGIMSKRFRFGMR